MKNTKVELCLAAMFAVLLAQCAMSQTVPSKYAFEPAHVDSGPPNEFGLVKVIKPPTGFVGSAAYDGRSNRLWLVAFGPPANTSGPSMLYEYDPETARPLARAKLPFQGECSAAAYRDGFVYVGVPHESKIYKIVTDHKDFGKVAGSIPVPMLADLHANPDEPFRFPFLSFFGMTVAPDGNLVIHANDVGLFITLERESGKVLRVVPTLRALAGIAAVPGPNGEFLILANADPDAAALRSEMRHFMFRSNHGITPPSQSHSEIACGRIDARDLRWVLLDNETGSVVAATTQQCTRAPTGSVALVGYERTAGTRYGKFRFLSSGEEGMLAVFQWTPGQDAFY